MAFNRAAIAAVNSILPSSGDGYKAHALNGMDDTLVQDTFGQITESYRNSGFSLGELDWNNSAMFSQVFSQQGVTAANGREYHDTSFYGLKPRSQASSFMALC